MFADLHTDRVYHYAPRALLAHVSSTVRFLHRAYDFYQEFLDIDYPHDCYQQVFLPGAPRPLMMSGVSLSGLSASLLHPSNVIDDGLQALQCGL